MAYMEAERSFPDGLEEQVAEALQRLEEQAGKSLGDSDDPLLVSVRSGARESMPGMLDTVLNLGLNDESVEGLARGTDNERFAWDSYRRFVQMFGNVCRGIPGERYEDLIKEAKSEAGVKEDVELDVDALKALTDRFKEVFADETDEQFPQEPAGAADPGDPRGLRLVAGRPRGELPAHQPHPRRLGHRGQRAADGVRQQGRHVVQRRRVLARRDHRRARALRATSCRTRRARTWCRACAPRCDLHEMKEAMPDAYDELIEILRTLEAHYKDMQDTEFTVEEGSLFMLQTRNAKRPAQAAVRFAVDAVEEGLLDRAAAIATIDAGRSTRCCTRRSRATPTSRCWPRAWRRRRARPRARSCSPPRTRWPAAEDGREVILVRPFTEADDVAGFHAAKGILTAEGGKASPRCARGQGDGQAVRVGGARPGDRPQGQDRQGRRHDARRGRPDRDRRLGRRRHRRRRPARGARGVRALPDGADVGGRAAHARRPHQRRHARGRPQGPRVRGRGHRPVPHRAHVHGRGPPAQDARDDHGRVRGGPPARARRAAAAPAGGLRGPVRAR